MFNPLYLCIYMGIKLLTMIIYYCNVSNGCDDLLMTGLDELEQLLSNFHFVQIHSESADCKYVRKYIYGYHILAIHILYIT